MIKLSNSKIGAAQLIQAFNCSPDHTPILDLDGVLLSANHRIKLHDDGSLDLEHYRANSTAEQIAQDKELPLLEFVQWLNTEKRQYHVATARVLCDHTLALLESKGIRPIMVMGRQGENDRRKDHDLKCWHFLNKFDVTQFSSLVLIDDCLNNCKAAVSIGLKSINVIGSGVKA